MHKNPYAHFEFGLDMLRESNIKKNTKALVIRTLQCLELEDYLAVGDVIMQSLDVELSTIYLSPGPEYGIGIDTNYQNPSVELLLLDFEREMPQLKETIKLIRTGSNFKRYEGLKSFGEKIPVLECGSV